MPRRRGNPNWGSGQQPRIAPAAATEFEWKLQELGLTNETCVSSVQLRTWCAQNKNHRYIPEWLLKAWQCRSIQTSAAQLENAHRGLEPSPLALANPLPEDAPRN